jgi:hypothetical protein
MSVRKPDGMKPLDRIVSVGDRTISEEIIIIKNEGGGFGIVSSGSEQDEVAGLFKQNIWI